MIQGPNPKDALNPPNTRERSQEFHGSGGKSLDPTTLNQHETNGGDPLVDMIWGGIRWLPIRIIRQVRTLSEPENACHSKPQRPHCFQLLGKRNIWLFEGWVQGRNPKEQPVGASLNLKHVKWTPDPELSRNKRKPVRLLVTS